MPPPELRGEPHHRGDPAADPFAADDDDGDEQEPDPELPVARREVGQIVLQQAVDQRADDAAIEIAGAADDEDQQHVGRAFEREHGERGEGLGLRQQRAGDPGIAGRERVDRDEAPVDRDADRGAAQRIALDRLERQPERRIDDAPRQQEQEEQHDEAVDVGGVAEHVEPAGAEDRRDGDALETVGAAGDLAEAVGELEAHQRDAERHHQPREVGPAQHQEARREAEHRRREAGRQERDGRLVDDLVLGEQARRIGADPEEGGVAERDDAGIAEDEIEREREQAPDHGLGQDQVLGRQQPDGREGDDPEQDLQRPEAGARAQEAGRGGFEVVAHRASYRAVARANRPCGRQISTTIMMV